METSAISWCGVWTHWLWREHDAPVGTIAIFPLSDILFKGYQDPQFRRSDDGNNKGYVKKKTTKKTKRE